MGKAYCPFNPSNAFCTINVLKFAMVIINYCAALHVVWTSHVTENPNPVILNVTNNSSALSWTLHTCIRSKIGQMLACFFCSLLINMPLGINSQWISTINNKIADDIFCLKKHSDINSSPAFDHTVLKQMYLEMRHCSFFQILSTIRSNCCTLVDHYTVFIDTDCIDTDCIDADCITMDCINANHVGTYNRDTIFCNTLDRVYKYA
jgi:hypothetical protein